MECHPARFLGHVSPDVEAYAEPLTLDGPSYDLTVDSPVERPGTLDNRQQRTRLRQKLVTSPEARLHLPNYLIVS